MPRALLPRASRSVLLVGCYRYAFLVCLCVCVFVRVASQSLTCMIGRSFVTANRLLLRYVGVDGEANDIFIRWDADQRVCGTARIQVIETTKL